YHRHGNAWPYRDGAILPRQRGSAGDRDGAMPSAHRPGPSVMRVLLASDGSEDARAASAWLGQFTLPTGSRLRVVSVVSIPPSALALPTVRDFIASLREEAQRTAEDARAQIAHRFGESEAQVLEGDAREAILRTAEEWPADLVVLGARGLG